MATKNMAYDHPAYTSVQHGSFAIAAGSGSPSVPKFLAFTSLVVKSVTLKPNTGALSTSADIASLIQISGTTTTTYGLGTTGSAATVFANYLPGSAANLLQGDTYYVVKGTDATLALTGVIETVVSPLANVTL
jgi:hypothetical protein